MKTLLFVTSSVSGPESKSTQVARELVAALRAQHGSVRLIERDLGTGAIPHLAGEHLQAQMTAPDLRSQRHRLLANAGDALLEEVEAADAIVITAPMYNFSIPSTLKAWIDHITRAGRTFRYTAEGTVEGLLKNKKVYVVTARGGIYTGDTPARALDFQEPYLRAILGFNGLTDVTFIHVEGQRISPTAAEAGLTQARKAIGEFVSVAKAA